MALWLLLKLQQILPLTSVKVEVKELTLELLAKEKFILIKKYPAVKLLAHLNLTNQPEVVYYSQTSISKIYIC